MSSKKNANQPANNPPENTPPPASRFALLQKQIPAFWLLVLVALAIAIPSPFFLKQSSVKIQGPALSGDTCPPHPVRRNDRKLIRPLTAVETPCLSTRLDPLRQEIAEVLAGFKNDGTVTEASVYLEDLERNEWTAVNEKLQFQPSSLIKVPVMMAFCRMAERTPGLLDAKIVAQLPSGTAPIPQTFGSKSITLGQTYTLRELLRYVISYSDNTATVITNNYVDIPTVERVFTDLGLSKFNFFDKSSFYMTAKDYAVFLRAIFNATYLSETDSEFAADLMSQCDFDKGFRQVFPANARLFHKFGEGGDQNRGELHEAGVVYLNGSPYLLVVMTRGKSVQKLPKVIQSVAKAVNDALGSNT
ncbi:MAG: serine hydrolase [Saprospiraceae bacterium]